MEVLKIDLSRCQKHHVIKDACEQAMTISKLRDTLAMYPHHMAVMVTTGNDMEAYPLNGHCFVEAVADGAELPRIRPTMAEMLLVDAEYLASAITPEYVDAMARQFCVEEFIACGRYFAPSSATNLYVGALSRFEGTTPERLAADKAFLQSCRNDLCIAISDSVNRKFNKFTPAF